MNKENSKSLTPIRLFWAIFVGLIGALFISIVTPYVDIIINCNANAADLCDGYLPKGAMFVLLTVILVLNPVLRMINRQWTFNTRQMAIVIAIALISSVVPGDGLLRRLPYNLAGVPAKSNLNATRSATYAKLNLPPSLFPDKLGYNVPTPACDYFIQELPPLDPKNPSGPKMPIPWMAWLPPLISWGAMLLSSWLMMIGMAQIVLPQWQNNERLPFPLLSLQRSLIETSSETRLFAPVFYSHGFWIGAAMAFILASMFKFTSYWPDKIPAIPLSWDLSRCFAEIPLMYLPGHIKANQIFFIIIGVSFFMPARISFSLWFFVLAYGLYQMIGQAYMPPFYGSTASDHKNGAILSITLCVIWLGRTHWKYVFKLLFRKPKTEEESYYRDAVVKFVLGFLGIIAWLIWVGVNPLWAILLAGFIFMISFITTRVVSETGLPYLHMLTSPDAILGLMPVSWLSPLTAYFSPVLAQLFSAGSVANPMGLGIHAIAMDEEGDQKYKKRLSFMLLAILIITFVICGAVHLYGNYHHSITMDGKETPLNPWFFDSFNYSLPKIDSIERGVEQARPPYNQIGHIIFGAALAGGLEWASLNIPTWPLHPIGILVTGWYLDRSWVSLLIGWLLKILILRYGGSSLYRKITPFFIGLIIGDVIHLVLWGLIPGFIVIAAPSLMPQ